MNGKLEKVKGHPGIYRRGNRYVVTFRESSGRQAKRFAKTLREARDLKASLRADVTRGEYRAASTDTFAEYAITWIETYAGRTRKGILHETRSDYRKRLEQDAIPFFGRMRLAAIEPQHIRDYAHHVESRGVKANTVRLALAPVKALLATAFEDGKIRSNPAAGVRFVQQRDSFNEDGADEDVRALSPGELAALLVALPPEWRLFFRFLADTGLRIGEAIELRWRDVDLGAATVRISRKFYRGRVGRPKSKFGRRTIRLTTELGRELWTLRKDTRGGDDDLLFTAERGGRIDQSNLMSRVLKPAARTAGVGQWVGFHSFRHTCATSLFRAGWNAVQVQHWLGHHKPSFTIDTYVHLLEEDIPDPIAVAVIGGNGGATEPAETSRNASEPPAAVSAN